MTQPRFKVRVFEFWTYDVWGNRREGYEVNDRRQHGTVAIRCKLETFNIGTPHEFTTYNPSDRQLSRAVNGMGLSWEGQDGAYYAETKYGKPVCELIEVS